MTTQHKEQTHIIFLRGVMPIGKNRVPMAHLREILSAAGFGNVRAYIQSGNVMVNTMLSIKETEQRIHDLILKHIGADIAVIGRKAEDIEKVLAENPFVDGFDIKRVFFALMAAEPGRQKTEELLLQDFQSEELFIKGKTAYMFIPGTYERGKLSNNFLERKLAVSATTRNYNTLTKLISISREEPS